MSVIERAAFLIGGIMLITTNITVNIVGVALLVAGVFMQKRKIKKVELA